MCLHYIVTTTLTKVHFVRTRNKFELKFKTRPIFTTFIKNTPVDSLKKHFC